jgi:purine catabolism regulator
MPIALRPLPDPATFAPVPQIRVCDLLELPAFAGARALTTDGLDRLVTDASVLQLPGDPSSRKGDLVLVGDHALRGSTAVGELLDRLGDREVAAVAARATALGGVRDELATAGRCRGLAVLELSDALSLSDVLMATLGVFLETHVGDLRQASAVRDQLGRFVLSGGRLDALPDVVAELASGDVAVIGPDGALMAASAGLVQEDALALAEAWLTGGWSSAAVADPDWVIWPVVAEASALGCLVARLPGRMDSARVTALQYTANSAALEVLRRREAVDVAARMRRSFVTDLLSGSLEPAAARRRAAARGCRPDSRFVVAVASGRMEPAGLSERADVLEVGAIAVELRGACVVILPLADQESATADALAAALLDAGPDVHVGMSGPLDSLAELPAGFRQAEEALEAAQVFDRRIRVRRHPELGSLRLLAAVPVAELHRFADDVLAPLERGEVRDGPLLATLSELIATGLNVAETGRRQESHYNTVRYRLRRLEEMLGPFTTDGALLQALALALVLRRELGPVAR